MAEANPREYAPDFPAEDWSEKDRLLLSPFATNPDGFISVLRNLPAEIVGALCSRASRASGSLLRVLLKEYFYPILDGEDKNLGKELEETVIFLGQHGFKNILNNQRAQQFYAKWLSQYGDDSIAQMTGTHVAFWGISQVAMKFVEDQRVGLEPIEKSSRYVNFGGKVGGKYLYYVPKPDLANLGLLQEYCETLDDLFDTYVALQPSLLAWLKEKYEEKDSVLEKKVFDTLRGLLPMATLGQVAFRGNAQALEYLVNRTSSHALGELRWLARELKQELDKEIPSLLLRVNDQKSIDYQNYLAGRKQAVRRLLGDTETDNTETTGASGAIVKLIEFDPEAEKKIAAGIIFEASHTGWEEALALAKKMSEDELKHLFEKYLSGRTARWQKVGRAFENSYLRFEILMDAGAYRDLHRHRMMTQERQPFSTHHGYDIPEEIKSAGLAEKYSAAMEKAAGLFAKIESADPELAQYVVPMAYRVRFYEWQNFRQMFWEAELRTISQGHPNYRHVEQEKYRLVKEKFPLLGELMLVDMNEYDFARRGVEKQIEAKEERILDGLKKKAP
ncbi:MAG: FAD-dependent thymidylate synthase [Patescibacteria group bacterium]|nr:FAD-dependent thymidylate synthase [Patescibacteria group bacterium]MDE2015298.1 FAD-dependent thymidylate synthase [Patescibacteria group bacterium]MDE2227103.1 FAD-dependent thymidylate synthase [Patescibacteria group bacterium]